MTFILDNGSWTIKAGNSLGDNPVQVQNCIARTRNRKVYIGAELSEPGIDLGGLVTRRAVERGQVASWECERAIWDTLNGLRDAESMIVTEGPIGLSAVGATIDQIIFEEYEMKECLRTSTASLVGEAIQMEKGRDSAVIVDCGYGATTVVPILNGKVVRSAIRRLDIGGKVLRNYLKETISYRHYNMMDESAIVNEIKDSACYVALNFADELERWRATDGGSCVLEYVLPHVRTGRGYVSGRILQQGEKVSDDEQVLRLTNERFSVPEILFRPSDIGLQQAGLPEVVMQAVEAVSQGDDDIRALLYTHVEFIGGGTLLKGFTDRMRIELRKLAPADIEVGLVVADDPIIRGWQSGSLLARNKPRFNSIALSREDYFERGSR
ncbi:actin family [Dipodascopsis uninucleata]